MSQAKYDDFPLVEQAKAGDQRAYGLLFERHRPKLAQMIMYLVHDRAEAEDLVQESFIKAYRALHHFRGDSAFFTWLACIGINTAKNYLNTRRRRSQSEVFLSDQADNMPEDERTDIVTPEDVCACHEIVAIVNAAFDTLNDEQRRAISLHEEDGLSYQEIAEAMGSPIGTVRSRISDARTTIAKRLAQVNRVSYGSLRATH
jgi:RNA polymerase sigma-70 factor (ECF subfamily)